MATGTRDTEATQSETPGHLFLRDGGEMGALTRAYDWSSSPLGNPEAWPQSLKTAVRLILTSAHPMFIWWGPDLIQFYNDAYSQTMGPERHPSALGERGRDCWAEIWPVIGPQIEFVMSGEGATWNEDQLVPVTRHGARREVWWTYGYSPIDDQDGVGGVLVVCKDVTDEHLAREALAEANARLETDARRLHELFAQAPGFIAVVRGPDHTFEFTNAAYERLVGRVGLVGKAVLDVLPEVEGQGFVELLNGVYKCGEPYVGEGFAITLQRTAQGPAEQLYVDFVYQPVRDASGVVTGIFVEGYDVTARVLADNQHKLVADEMNHRVKNTLATVQSLARLTGKSAKTVKEFGAVLADRIHAMAKTQDLLLRGQAGSVEVEEILQNELAPYLGNGDQVELECQPMQIAPHMAVNLGLMVHELLTNAAKHGALSTTQGSLMVRCEHQALGGVLTWHEITDREVTSNGVKGFGSSLIHRLAHALGGEANMKLSPGGLRARITFDCTPEAIAVRP
jgi:two-component sensor histidine kinase